MTNNDKIKEEMEKCKASPQYFFDNYCRISQEHDLPPCEPEKLKELWESAMPKLKNSEMSGKVIITSTPVGNNFFFDLFLKGK